VAAAPTYHHGGSVAKWSPMAIFASLNNLSEQCSGHHLRDGADFECCSLIAA